MKPVVSSLVALAIAIAPLAAMAASPEKSSAAHHGKAPTTKLVKHKDQRSEKHDKPIAKVKHSGKKPALHHASHVDVSGGGHHEPKVEKHVSVVPASLMTKTADHVKVDKKIDTKVDAKKDKIQKVSHTTSAVAPAPKANEMPKLPDPKATKPAGKNAHEKGAKKAVEKKSEPKGESASNDGESQRDEELAELVARIRRGESKGRQGAKPPCLKDPVEIIRGPEIQRMELMTCDGAPAPLAVEQLSILIRPGSAARPTTPASELAKKKGPDLAPGIRRVDTRLVERIQAVVDHFAKKQGPTKLSIISGYRPTSVGSMHSSGRAIDFRMEGVKNEDVVAFCKTLGDTGCGFYPNSSFVHIDVRDPGAGHVAWIDASGPGETPRYVSQCPLPERSANKDETKDEIRKPADVLEHTSAKRTEAPATAESEPIDEHPAAPKNAPAEPPAALDEPEKDSAKTAED